MSERQFECADCEAVQDLIYCQQLSNGNRVCGSCYDTYFCCDHCEEHAERTERGRTDSREEICDACQQAHFEYSTVQQCFIPRDCAVTLLDTGEVVSESYAESYAFQTDTGDFYEDEENVPSGNVLPYDDDVLVHCKSDRNSLKRGDLMFGVELEMEPAEHACQLQLVDALGGCVTDKFILKEDGSLCAEGVELVTIPLSLEDHISRFDWEQILAPLLSIAKSGVDTHSCGMHVHINKAALSTLQIGKMLVFLNSPALRGQVTTIAQRESNQYCERSAKKFTDGAAASRNRHDVVNVGPNTVEIRMFRGNLRFERVYKNLEFCHALVLFCRDVSLVEIERWDTFAAWLLKRRGQYPHLVKFLAEKKVARFSGVVRERKGQAEEAVTCA